jgi:hypothetical protein
MFASAVASNQNLPAPVWAKHRFVSETPYSSRQDSALLWQAFGFSLMGILCPFFADLPPKSNFGRTAFFTRMAALHTQIYLFLFWKVDLQKS